MSAKYVCHAVLIRTTPLEFKRRVSYATACTIQAHGGISTGGREERLSLQYVYQYIRKWN